MTSGLDRSQWRRVLHNREGAVAAEFALVTPILILVTVGTINLCAMLLAVISLHFAVEDAARCSTAKPDICFDAASTAAYAARHYKAPGTRPQFLRSIEACGNRVVGTSNYTFMTGLTMSNVPLSATACFSTA
jgi:hypothetical protein